jgi:anti-sigma regulatory factor (Ser/Thr protein kinase)
VSNVITTLPREPASTRLAREVVTDCIEGASDQLHDDALLLTTELVANALQHGEGLVTLRVSQEPGELLIEVSDEGRGAIEMTPKPSSLGGWGLRVVDRVADDWGVRPGSTRVWFRLSFDSP